MKNRIISVGCLIFNSKRDDFSFRKDKKNSPHDFQIFAKCIFLKWRMERIALDQKDKNQNNHLKISKCKNPNTRMVIAKGFFGPISLMSYLTLFKNLK